MRFEADLDHLPVILEESEKEMARLGIPKAHLEKMQLVMEEAIVNVIHYAYPNKSPKPVDVTMSLKDNTLQIVIKDEGIPFNPCDYSKAVDVNASLEERSIGGLGIFFIKKIVDAMTYRRDNNRNELTLTKKV